MTKAFAEQFEDDFGDGTVAQPGRVSRPVNPASTANPTAPSMDRAFTTSYREDCKACSGTGKFRSWSGRLVGDCFKCKGQGFRMFKTNAAERAANRAQTAQRKLDKAAEALEQFAAQHPAEAAWIASERATFDFAQSMHEAIQKFGSLTSGQLAACTRAVERVAARKAAAVARVEAAPVVDMAKIEAAFGAALQSGLRSPKLVLGELVLSPAKATSQNAGAIYVKGGKAFEAPYYGKILNGKFIKSRDCSAEIEALVLETAKDPLAAAIAYGKKTGICACCSRELTNALSIELGIGPICRGKWGL